MAAQYPREMLLGVFQDRNLAPNVSERDVLFELVDTVFFASLMLEEGQPVRVAAVHHEGGAAELATVVDGSPDADEEPAAAWDVTVIDRCPFDARTLAKLSRGLAYGAQLVVVGGAIASELWIDGIARRSPRTDGGDVIRIAAPRPGVLVFERHLSEVLRFEAGRALPVTIDVLGANGPVRRAVGRITGDGSTFTEGYSFTESALRQLLRQMRATAAGGILAMCPAPPSADVLANVKFRRADTKLLARRIADEKKKRLSSLFGGMGDLSEDLSPEAVRARDARRADADAATEALHRAIDDVARLSAIDGAVLTGPGLEVYGAGYIIPTIPKPTVVSALDAEMSRIPPYQDSHGARHQAALSFAYSNPGGVAFVVSEDGPVSCALRVDVDGPVVLWSVRVSET